MKKRLIWILLSVAIAGTTFYTFWDGRLPVLILPSSPLSAPNVDAPLLFVHKTTTNGLGGKNLELVVLNNTLKTIYFQTEFPGFGRTHPKYTKQIATENNFVAKPIHCGIGWKTYSLPSGFGTRFQVTLHKEEIKGRFGFNFGYEVSMPWGSEVFTEPIEIDK